MAEFKAQTKKILIGIIGGLVTLIGLVMVPYPGPGWLVVFAGLAILGTEFEFAARIRTYAKGKYDGWVEWLKRQPWGIRILSLAVTGAVVIVTLWLLNTFSIIAGVFGVDWQWVVSPLFR